MYVSLAPDMEPPSGADPPSVNAARCDQYTCSDKEGSRPAPTTDDRVAGKRPTATEPSAAEAVPAAAGPIMGQGLARTPERPSGAGLSKLLMTTTKKKRWPQIWSADPVVAQMSPQATEVWLPEIRLLRTLSRRN